MLSCCHTFPLPIYMRYCESLALERILMDLTACLWIVYHRCGRTDWLFYWRPSPSLRGCTTFETEFFPFGTSCTEQGLSGGYGWGQRPWVKGYYFQEGTTGQAREIARDWRVETRILGQSGFPQSGIISLRPWPCILISLFRFKLFLVAKWSWSPVALRQLARKSWTSSRSPFRAR